MMQSEWQSNRFPSFVWNNDGKYTHMQTFEPISICPKHHTPTTCAHFNSLDWTPKTSKCAFRKTLRKLQLSKVTIESKWKIKLTFNVAVPLQFLIARNMGYLLFCKFSNVIWFLCHTLKIVQFVYGLKIFLCQNWLAHFWSDFIVLSSRKKIQLDIAAT